MLRAEIKKLIFSFTFILYIIGGLSDQFTQLGEYVMIEKPLPGQAGEYGTYVKETPEILMPNATDYLLYEYSTNRYVAYPVGFYKEVRLGEKKRAEMTDIILEFTTLSTDELQKFAEAMQSHSDEDYYELPEYSMSPTLTYERFRELISKADELIGGGSEYGEEFLLTHFSRVEKTYEQAAMEYEAFQNDLSGSAARIACDYAGIFLTGLAVFPALALMSRDKRCRDVIYTRSVGSVKLIFTRYFASVLMMSAIIPVIMTAAFIGASKLYDGLNIFIFFAYGFGWLLPGIMFGAAMGVFLSLLFGAGGVLIYGAFWFIQLNANAALVGGNTLFSLMIRHNSFADADIFAAELPTVIANRCIYFALSLIIVVISAGIYELKRGGRAGDRALIHRIAKKSAA